MYTNEVHPESSGFSFQWSLAVWNNSDPDRAGLFDQLGKLVSTMSYGDPPAGHNVPGSRGSAGAGEIHTFVLSLSKDSSTLTLQRPWRCAMPFSKVRENRLEWADRCVDSISDSVDTGRALSMP